MNDTGLGREDLRWLRHYAQDRQDQQAPDEVLARLETLGLLMRGWSGSHIVTARGQQLLEVDAKRDG
jgi:hypothetical protein